MANDKGGQIRNTDSIPRRSFDVHSTNDIGAQTNRFSTEVGGKAMSSRRTTSGFDTRGVIDTEALMMGLSCRLSRARCPDDAFPQGETLRDGVYVVL